MRHTGNRIVGSNPTLSARTLASQTRVPLLVEVSYRARTACHVGRGASAGGDNAARFNLSKFAVGLSRERQAVPVRVRAALRLEQQVRASCALSECICRVGCRCLPPWHLRERPAPCACNARRAPLAIDVPTDRSCAEPGALNFPRARAVPEKFTPTRISLTATCADYCLLLSAAPSAFPSQRSLFE